MFFEQIFEEKLAQYAYVIGCQKSGEAVVIDPMRDIDRYDKLAAKHGLTIVAAADTHIHADYISGLREFAAALTAPPLPTRPHNRSSPRIGPRAHRTGYRPLRRNRAWHRAPPGPS